MHIEDRQRAIQSVSVAINGRRLASSRPRNNPSLAIPLGQRVLDLEVPIELERGDNLIEVVVTNGVAETHRQLQLSTRVSTPPDSLPELWILAIGINEYSDDRWLRPLQYAAEDAEAVADFYTHQEGLLFSKVHTLLITNRADLKPTHDTIADNLSFLRNAGARDVAMLFIAGTAPQTHWESFRCCQPTPGSTHLEVHCAPVRSAPRRSGRSWICQANDC
jgi:hypothetical protein